MNRLQDRGFLAAALQTILELYVLLFRKLIEIRSVRSQASEFNPWAYGEDCDYNFDQSEQHTPQHLQEQLWDNPCFEVDLLLAFVELRGKVYDCRRG